MTDINKLHFQKNEHKFYLLLISYLGCEYEIIKSNDFYCNIDFIVINKQNLKTLYIEHKCRNINDIYDTLLIGTTKINSIQKNYTSKCILVWEFLNDKFYFKKIEQDFIKKYKHSCVRGSDCLEIIKKDCFDGIINLIKLIKFELN